MPPAEGPGPASRIAGIREGDPPFDNGDQRSHHEIRTPTRRTEVAPTPMHGSSTSATWGAA